MAKEKTELILTRDYAIIAKVDVKAAEQRVPTLLVHLMEARRSSRLRVVVSRLAAIRGLRGFCK